MVAVKRWVKVLGTTATILSAAPGIAQADELGMGRWSDLIDAAARRFEIPQAWIFSVMDAESAGQETVSGRPITSAAGAMGLMQIMPDTWAELRLRYGLGDDPYNPHDNIFAGTAYLRELYQRFGYPNLFAAYNAGPRRLDVYLWRGGEPLPNETRNYLAKLGGLYSSRQIAPDGKDGGLFFDLRTCGRERTGPTAGGLFIVLRTMPVPR